MQTSADKKRFAESDQTRPTPPLNFKREWESYVTLTVYGDNGDEKRRPDINSPQLNGLVIYEVQQDVTDQYIREALYNQHIGIVKKVKFIPYYDGQEQRRIRACILMQTWFNNPASRNFRMRLVQDRASIVHNDPDAWEVALLPTGTGPVDACKYHKQLALNRLLLRVNPFIHECVPTPTIRKKNSRPMNASAEDKVWVRNNTDTAEDTEATKATEDESVSEDADWAELSAALSATLDQYRREAMLM